MKYPRASRALRQAPDPTLKPARFTGTMLLHTIGNLGLSRSGPPPIKSWIRPCVCMVRRLARRCDCCYVTKWVTSVLDVSCTVGYCLYGTLLLCPSYCMSHTNQSSSSHRCLYRHQLNGCILIQLWYVVT